MGFLSLFLRRIAPLLAVAAAGVVLARRRAEANRQIETPYEPPAPAPIPSRVEEAPVDDVPVEEPAIGEAPVLGATPPAATDAEVVRSVYDAPPVEDPVEEDIDGESDPSRSVTVTDVVDDLLGPLPSEDEIEDATVVDDTPGAGDSPPGDYAR